MVSTEFPHLAQMRSLSECAQIDQIDVDELTERSFKSEFVNCQRPLLVKRAVRHWSAFERWQSPQYLCDAVGEKIVHVQVAPMIEYPRPSLVERMEKSLQAMSFREFVDKILNDERGYHSIHSCPMSPPAPLGPLEGDVGGLAFLPNPATARWYRNRAFIYRGSYSDWHYHPADENFLCQIRGDKEVLLLPPDERSFQTVNEIARKVGYVYDVDRQRFPSYGGLRPYRATLSAGDALYIPTFWWHAVEAPQTDWGISVAWVWRSPNHLFDPRLPGVRQILKRASFSPRGLFTAGVALYSYAYGTVSPGVRRARSRYSKTDA